MKFGYAKTWDDYVRLINSKYFEHTHDKHIDFALITEDQKVLDAYKKMMTKQYDIPECEIK